VGRRGDVVLPVDDVVTAIGFAADPAGLAVPGAYPDGRADRGLYAAGWLRRGPRGAIPDQRTDARALARVIAEDLVRAARCPPGPPSRDLTASWTSTDGAASICANGSALRRAAERAKLRTIDDMLAAARDPGLRLPADDVSDVEAVASGIPVSVLFGTESGGAELVAGELAELFGDDVLVRDLADTSPRDLDPERLHLIVCSTYGDGEVPTAARPFHVALREDSWPLDGLRYAVFGMGDRSYAKTYSRGSEMIDEALAARGATRIGEYGRHDAGGPLDAPEAAREWVAGVIAEAAALRAR
jgi:Sulfite reductase, alpha subunit (flavoprotein)